MDETLNIGALSKMTGIPTDTLRTWERRYGFPSPERTTTGHRRYSMNTCERLRQIRRLLDAGYRPSVILGWSPDELAEALAVAEEGPAVTAGSPSTTSEVDDTEARQEIVRWIDHCRSFAADELDRGFEQAWSRLAALDMLEQYVGPFLTELGERWAAQRLGVQHEHFVSHRLAHFLESKWRPLANLAQGSMIACATLRGEEHTLGLQLAATTLVLVDCRILYLGANLPAENLVRAAQQHRVRAIAISVSTSSNPADTKDELQQIHHELPRVPIVVGGAGAPADLDGIERVASLSELQRWATRL